MALRGGHRFKVSFDEMFPAGAYAVTEVEKVRDFDRSTRDKLVQEVDKITGVSVWQVQVLDADPNARKQEKTVTVKLLAEHQPVLPETPNDGPLVIPVEFDDPTVTPYVEDRSKRLTYSLRASGVRAPSRGVKTQAAQAANGANGSAATAPTGAANGAKESAKEPGKDEAAKATA